MANIGCFSELNLNDREKLIKQLEEAIEFIHLMEKELVKKPMSDGKFVLQRRRYNNAIRHYNELIRQAKKQNLSCSKEELANNILK